MDAFISTIAKTINSLHVLLEVEKAFKIFFGMNSMTLYRDDFPIHCNFVAFFWPPNLCIFFCINDFKWHFPKFMLLNRFSSILINLKFLTTNLQEEKIAT